jgi:dynein heavy chain
VYRDLEKEVKNMSVSLPLVNDLHSPFMRPRHWKEVARVCECKSLDPTDSKFCLEDLLSRQLHNHADDIMEIVETASKELKIERKMEAIERVWNGLDLDYVPHKDSDVFIVRPSDQVVESLEEHQMELQVCVCVCGVCVFVHVCLNAVHVSWCVTTLSVPASIDKR